VRKSTTVKIVRLVKRRADLTLAEFKDYWLTRHAPHERRAIETTSLQKVVASFVLPDDHKDPEFDGVAELYFSSLEEIRTMFAGPVPAMMREDEENFVQMDAPAVRLVAEEYVIGEKGRTA